MDTLHLKLLGPPEINLAGAPVVQSLPAKVQAILYYLAVTGQPQPRSVLASLLWGDLPEADARTNLRKAIASLRQVLGNYLDLDRQEVRFKPDSSYWVDVTEFVTKASDPSAQVQQLEEAVALYRSDFLAGFYVRQALDFENWMLAEQARLREWVIQTLQTLAAHHAEQGKLAHGIGYVRRLLSLEPWREEAHRQLMLLLAQNGQRSAALAQYETCRQTLAEELGVEPGPETKALYQRIRDGEVGRGVREQESRGEYRSPAPLPLRPSAPPHNLPAQITTFIGRKQELTKIQGLLLDEPACRLLVLVGPGGIGKTRLAMQVAQQLIADPARAKIFGDGIMVVPLASVSTPHDIVPTIAEAARFQFHGNLPLKEQLLNYLQHKRMLLVLDNFEHLLDQSEQVAQGAGADLVSQILATALGLKILVTSREALNLQEAWFQPLIGLGYPESAAEPLALGEHDAIKLFEQSARRVRVNFSLVAEQEHIVRICQLVQGMPLGLELAAAWLSILPPEKIAREIERGLDILTTRYQNVPERHRSIRAVFEHSWQMLAGQEQNMLKGLAVFKGSFTQEAAEQVAGASLLSMVTLVDKSLLGVTAAGRYHLHELLRQFAMEKLQARPEEEKATKTRHSAYYLGFISSREARLTGQSQQAALVEIAEEINNVRTGWDWAVKQGQFEAIERALETLYHFYWDRSLLQKGREVFKQAAERLEISNLADLKDRPGLRLRAKLLARQGAFCYALSLYEAATELLQTALALGQELAAQAEIAFCLNFLGNIARNQGDYPAAEQKYQEGLVITKAIADQASTAFNLYSLGFIGEVKGEYSLAKQYYLESLALNRAISNQLGIAQGLDKMGVVSFALGEYTQAEQYYRESLALFEQLNNRLGMALALGGLGLVAWGLGGPKLIEAKQYFETSLAACQESGNRLQMVVRLALLGYVHNSLGHYELAQQHCQEAITLAREIGFKAGLSFALNALGEAACGRSDFLAARRYLDEALETALHSQNHADVLAILVNWAALLVKEERLAAPKQPGATGRMAQAVEILAFAGNHPTNRRIFKDKAAGLVAELELELGVTIVAKIKERGQSRTLAEVVAEIL